MADVGGTLRFADISLAGQLPPGLPAFIPQVDTTRLGPLDGKLRWPAYAVGLRRVFSWRTHQVYPRWLGGSARDVLGLAPDQHAVLVGYGEDPLIEGFWTQRRAQRLAETIAQMGWSAVLAPNFSVYANHPRAEHLINLRRSLMAAAELAAAGACAVPNVYWMRLEDLDRYLDWVASLRPGGPAALACNVQTFRTRAEWEEMALPGLALLARGLPAGMPVVITGASRPGRIADLAALFGGRLHLISQNPLQYARHGALMTVAGRAGCHAAPGVLFTANVRFYAHLLEPHGGNHGDPDPQHRRGRGAA